MPIFIFGSPRSGVTLLENILGIHPELAWLSQYNNQHPKRAEVSIINRLFDIPIIGSTIYGNAWKKTIIASKKILTHFNSWNLVDKYFLQYSNPPLYQYQLFLNLIKNKRLIWNGKYFSFLTKC